jgi:hypothetical protein
MLITISFLGFRRLDHSSTWWMLHIPSHMQATTGRKRDRGASSAHDEGDISNKVIGNKVIAAHG